MGAVLKESMWDREEYFKGISIVKITAFVLLLFGMMVMVGQVNGQDNKTETETKPNVTTPYIPSKVEQKAGKYGDTQYWPYPSWQITGYVNNCVILFHNNILKLDSSCGPLRWVHSVLVSWISLDRNGHTMTMCKIFN